MFEFGDELIIESYRIPWLIWIQLLITLLLILILFFGFTVFDDIPATSIAASPTNRNAAAPMHLETPIPSSSNRINKVGDQRTRRDVGTSGATVSDCEGTSGVTISEEEDHLSGEESSLKEPILLSIFQSTNHPCHYIGLAKRALFKCFGLDSSSESSNNCRHDKRD